MVFYVSGQQWLDFLEPALANVIFELGHSCRIIIVDFAGAIEVRDTGILLAYLGRLQPVHTLPGAQIAWIQFHRFLICRNRTFGVSFFLQGNS